MVAFGVINIPLVIGGIGTLLFFIWLGKYAERTDKKRERKNSKSMRKKWQKMKQS